MKIKITVQLCSRRKKENAFNLVYKARLAIVTSIS